MPSSPDPGRSERLADVYARAERLRRQRRARVGTGALLGSLAVFMVGLLVGSNLGITQQLTTIGRPDTPSSTTTTERRTTTTSDLLVGPDPGEVGSGTPPDGEDPTETPPTTQEQTRPPATSPPATAPEATPDTTTFPPCRNSSEPVCGPFRYDPQPVNEPMAVEVTFSPENPEPGEEITFTVQVSDDGPAGPGETCGNNRTYGEPDELVSFCAPSCAIPEPKHGPWDPPPPDNARIEETLRHTYAEPGTYTATFAYNQGGNCSDNPFFSQGEASVTVTVR